MTCTRYNGRGPGGPSLDQILARKLGSESRFRSLQVGVSQECFGGAMQRNMSWAGADRSLPPEEIPHRLFDRLFGAKDEGWVRRKRSILQVEGSGWDIGAAVAFLCGGNARWMTGAIVPVDAGATAIAALPSGIG